MRRVKKSFLAVFLAAAFAAGVPGMGDLVLATEISQNGLTGRQDSLAGDSNGLPGSPDSLTGDLNGLSNVPDSLTGDLSGLPDAPDSLTNSLDALTQNLEGLTEDLDGEMSEEELDAVIERYFKEIESGAIGTETPVSGKITDPVLKRTWTEDEKVLYTLPNGNYFVSTVPMGILCNGPVELFLPAGTVGVVRRDDVLDAMPDSWKFTAPGSYHIKLLSYQTGSAGGDYNVYEINFYFTIAGAVNNRLGAVPAPEGFRIAEVRLDGRPVPMENDQCFFTGADGRYEIWYEDTDGHKLPEPTVFTLDTTAPFLSFSKEIKGIETEGPVGFSPSEEGCRIGLSYNGEKGYAVGSELTAAGNYELRVEDAAGNQRSYFFRIRQTYKLFDVRIAAAGVVLMIGIAVWLFFLRRDMKVV